MTTPPSLLQQVIDEKEDEINVMRIVVAVLAVVVLFLLIILAYCTCTKRKKHSRPKDVEMNKTQDDDTAKANGDQKNNHPFQDKNYSEIDESDNHNHKQEIPSVKVTQDIQALSQPDDQDSLYEAMTEATNPKISSTKRHNQTSERYCEPDEIDIEAMRRLSRSNSMSLINSRSRPTTPTIEGAINRVEYYEAMGDFAQNQKPVTKSLSMPPARRQVSEPYKEPIYSEVNTYDRSLSVPAAKHQRSCSLDGRQSIPKDLLEKKRMSLPPPAKPPRRSSLKSNISSESGGGIIYSQTYESTNSLRSLDSCDGDYIIPSSRPSKKRAPPKPLRTSTENLYCVPKKFDRSQSQKHFRTDDKSQLILNMEKQPTRSRSEKPIRATKSSPPIVVQDYENFGFDKEFDNGEHTHNNNSTRKNGNHNITEKMDNQYVIQTSYDGLDYYGDNEVYTRMDGDVEGQNMNRESSVYEIVYR